MPIDHVKLPVSDLDASRAFYAAALAPFGFRLVYDEAPSLGFGRGDGGEDDEPFALERARPPNVSSHVAFTASSPAEVDAFHAAALVAGGRDNGAPGERPYGGFYYAAFVLDPDGHNIEAVFHGTTPRREHTPPRRSRARGSRADGGSGRRARAAARDPARACSGP